MIDRFTQCLPLVLVHEGGYVNHPKDPGGATNKGITQKTYDAWQRRAGKPPRSVKHIDGEEVAAIYRAQYWDKVCAGDMPAGLDYAVFDFAVNSGPSRSAKFLQEIVGVSADGIIGAQTLAAVDDYEPASVISQLCDNRLAWLKRLTTFKTFGNGWTRRVNEVKGAALAMNGGQGYQDPVGSAQGSAEGAETISSTVKDIAKDPKAWGGAGALVTAVGGVAEGEGPMQYALAVVVVLAFAVLAYKRLRK